MAYTSGQGSMATMSVNDQDDDDPHLKAKADVKDLLALNEIKSNKFDTEVLMRCVDVQHKQI